MTVAGRIVVTEFVKGVLEKHPGVLKVDDVPADGELLVHMTDGSSFCLRHIAGMTAGNKA